MLIRCCRHTCAVVTFFLHCICYCVQVCHASDLWPYSALVVDAFEKRSPSEVQVLCLLIHAHCDGNQFVRQVCLRYACFVSAPFPHFNLFCNLHASGICALFSLYDPFHLFMLQCGCLPNGDNCTVLQSVQHTSRVAAYWVKGRAAKDDDFHTCL